MRLVRDRADARWLPSRYRYAAFRLLAWAMFRATRPQPRRGVVLGVDRDQSALESYSMAIWLTLTSSCLAYGIFGLWLPGGLAALISPIAAVVFLQIPITIVSIAAAFGDQQRSGRLVSVATLLIVTATAVHVASYESWPRYVAWSFLLVVAADAAAAVIAWIFRAQLVDTEREVGAA